MVDTDDRLPVRWMDTGINHSEGYCPPEQLEAMPRAGIHPGTRPVDGK
ncbi:MAG: hypothetical protein QW379_00165 [Thermoplasmata archaeon]